MDDFKSKLMRLLNKYSIDNQTNTPDFILADHLINHIANIAAMNEQKVRYGL